jgi:DNA-directed RNA polymerase subunit RPC12/RpoP
MSQELKCQTCGAAFGGQQELMEHSKIHMATSRQFKCEPCGAAFGSKEELMEHAKMHQ